MAGTVLNLKDMVVEDQLGCRIAQFWMEWNNARQPWIKQKREIREYVYATDTTTTSNSSLPWKNKTTVPKLCQIRDNLYANYIISLFPKRQWLNWEGYDKSSNDKAKRDAIENYMCWVVKQPPFKKEISKLILDYIDYGNCFGMPDWEDFTVEQEDKTQVGYVGPIARRISPLDIVFNPTTTSFEKSPKIVRSLVSFGEVKDKLTQFSTPETQEGYEKLWEYLKELRRATYTHTGDLSEKDAYYTVDGFDTFRRYLESEYAEILTFYGDIYDFEKDEYLRNHVVMVVDRHKVIHKAPNQTLFGHPPIFHVGWRPRQDNLWAMGPLDNLVGMQYRIDHVENLKADCFDLIAFPPLKVKGYVEDFTWGPMEKIIVGDDGDVEMLAPDVQVLQANQEIATLEAKMEEMAGAPKEALGFRTPGEKTAYEVQRLENAASRIFQNKTSQFEEAFLELLLNGMLELARRKMTGAQTIDVFDDEFKITTFETLTPQDLTGNGRLRPVAARHFAEKAEIIQNLTNLSNTPIYELIASHVSSINLAKLVEDLLNIDDYDIVEPYIALTEQADAQRLMHSHEEQVLMEAQTPSGLTEDDYDEDFTSGETTEPGMDEEPTEY
jgi:hypothetical protein